MADTDNKPKATAKKDSKSSNTSKLKTLANKVSPKKSAKSPEKVTGTKVDAKKDIKQDATKSNFQQKLARLGVKTKPNRKLAVISGLTALAALFITISVFGVLIYRNKSEAKAVEIAAKIIPYPILSVNGNPAWNTVSYSEYLFELASIKKFYQSQGQDLTTDDGKKRLGELKEELLKQLEDNQVILQEATKERITVNSKETDDEYNKLVEKAGGPDKVKQTLNELYGWSIDDFKKKVRFSLVQKKLADKISNDESKNGVAKAKAEDLLKQIKGGADFAELAKANSEDTSASNGGDLGFIEKGQTVPEFEEASFALKAGEVSGVVKTQFGYHIIKSVEVQDGKVHVAHILIKGVDLESWLKDQTSKAKVIRYIKL